MNNYAYILASAPDFKVDSRAGLSPNEAIEEILQLLGEDDRKTAEFLLKGFLPEEMTESFYLEAKSSENRFIREYFDFDKKVRNVRAAFINRAFDRNPNLGQILPDDDFDRENEVAEILSGKDILKKEREMDELMWQEAETLTELDILDFNLVLSLLTRLKIVSRWMNLDKNTGHAMLRKLVNELRQKTQ